MTASASGAKRASRLTSNPDHNNGIVNASGSRCVCRSIQASASKAATNPYAASACPLAPKRQNALAALIALRSSINKYRIGIAAQPQIGDQRDIFQQPQRMAARGTMRARLPKVVRAAFIHMNRLRHTCAGQMPCFRVPGAFEHDRQPVNDNSEKTPDHQTE